MVCSLIFLKKRKAKTAKKKNRKGKEKQLKEIYIYIFMRYLDREDGKEKQREDGVLLLILLFYLF